MEEEHEIDVAVNDASEDPIDILLDLEFMFLGSIIWIWSICTEECDIEDTKEMGYLKINRYHI